MTALAVPDVRLHHTWAATLRDFGAEYPSGSGMRPGETPDLSADGCADVVGLRLRHGDPAVEMPSDRVHCSYFWVLDDDPCEPEGHRDPMVGFLAVRHRLNELLFEEGGHIGYSVRPSQRRRGHAGRALRLGLAHAAGLGIEHVLVTCDVANEASRRTIEAAGGRHEDTRHGKLRFWIRSDVRVPTLR